MGSLVGVGFCSGVKSRSHQHRQLGVSGVPQECDFGELDHETLNLGQTEPAICKFPDIVNGAAATATLCKIAAGAAVA